jgi:RHS repeat-associated protein
MSAASSASDIPPELVSIAASLDNSLGRIIDWVANYIEYEAYNGLKRGPRLTALERAGNSFDTAALTVTLLRAAGFDASYAFVSRTGTFAELGNWLGVAPEEAFAFLVNGAGDYEARPASPAITNKIVLPLADYDGLLFPHVWVIVNIDGGTYWFDPSFKPYAEAAPADWVSQSGYSATELYNSAGGGNTTTAIGSVPVPAYTGNTAGKTALRAKLAQYTTVLTSNIANDDTQHARSGREVMGGRWLARAGTFPAPYGYIIHAFWNEIPDAYCAKLSVTVGGVSQTFNTAELSGAKLSVAFENSKVRLYKDDVLLASETTASGTTAAVTLGYTYCDDPATTTADPLYSHTMPTAPILRSGNYVITHGFNHVLGRVKERMRVLAGLRDQGLANDSRQVLSENLYILGLQYLNELNGINEVGSSVTPVRQVVQHHAGIVGVNQAPFVDLPVCLINSALRTNPPAGMTWLDVIYKSFMAGMYWASMLEHSAIEQTIVANADPANTYLNKGVSTMKLIQSYVDNAEPVYVARTLTEWNALKGASSPLIGYAGTGVLAAGDSVFSSNPLAGGMLVPKNYAQTFGNYSGMGYVAMHKPAGAGPGATMGITGALGTLNGGAAAILNPVINTSAITFVGSGAASYQISSLYNYSNPLATGGQTLLLDPVDAASGAFYVQATDLALGGAMPYGLAFTRYHSTALRFSDPTGLGKGWTHGYNIRLLFQHAGDLDLARASTAELAPLMVATRAIYDIFYSGADSNARQWVVPALVTCWLGDQLINTRAVVQMGERSMQFIKLPDGTFAPPPGIAATLVKNGTNHVIKFRKGLEITFREKDGRFTAITDKNTLNQTARTLTATYSGAPTDYDDNSRRLTQVTDAFGRTLTLTYSGDALTQVADGTGRSIHYSRSTSAFIYTDPENKTTTYAHDAKKRITSITDALGRMTVQSEYDDYDRVIKQWTYGDADQLWQYDYAPGTTRLADPLGHTSLYYFDERGRKVLHYNELGARSEWQYDGMDRVTLSITPPRDITYANQSGQIPTHEITSYLYNIHHELIAVQDPAGRIASATPSNDTSTTARTDVSFGGLETVTTYHANIHLPATVTHPGGIVETFNEYDAWGRLKKHHPAALAAGAYINYTYTQNGGTGYTTQQVATYPNGATETAKYNARGDIIETIDRAGIKTTYTYNNRRQQTSATVWNGATAAQTSQIFYDGAGNVLHTVAPNGAQTDYDYNADGKLISATGPDGATVTTAYDLRGLPVQITDPLGWSTASTYDAAQRLATVTDPLNRATDFTYDPLSNRLSATTPLGHTGQTFYDDARLLVTQTRDALNRPITFAYDDDGRQTAMTNRRNNTYTTAYDDANRTVTTATPEGKITETENNTRGLPLQTVRPSGRILKNTSFDAEGRVLTQQILDTDGQTVLSTVTMTYDTAGRLLTVSEGGKTTTRTYDALGRLATYADGEGNTIAYTYDVSNNLASITYPGAGNKTVGYAYDANNRLVTVTDWNDSVTHYTYDIAGRLVETARPNGTTRNHVYDAAGQLRFIEERGPAPTNTLLWMRALEYDADGRITKTYTHPSSVPVSTPAANENDTATHDADNRIATWGAGTGGTLTCVFDDDGNLFSGPLVHSPSAASPMAFAYDAHNRLTGAGGQTALYRYNPDGHRVEANGVDYIIDPNAALSRVLMRVDGGTTTYYIWGASGLEYEITGGTTKTYHADHLGSTMLLTNAAGAPTGEYFEYDSYGTPTHVTGNPTTPFRWHGTLGVTTEPNGLVHMRARFYHPRLMRFLNQDPIGFEGGMNWFAFVNDNPITGIDPSGLCRTEWSSGDPGDSYPQLNVNQIIGVSSQSAPSIVHQMIASAALAKNDSQEYLQSIARGNYDAGSNKCNQFPADIIEMVGLPRPQVYYTGILGVLGFRRDPSANEWANPKIVIDGWSEPRYVGEAQPGNIIAQQHGKWGHSGIVVGGSLTASVNSTTQPAGIITINNWGFRPKGENGESEKDPEPKVRRYLGNIR